MHPEDMFPPEALSYLGTLGISIVLVICFLALAVIIGLYFKKNREDIKRVQGCMKTEIPEDGEQPVCLQDQYAQSMVRPYMPEQEEDCPECPPCSCAIHGNDPKDAIKRIRRLVEEFKSHETGMGIEEFDAELEDLLDELEGKDDPS